MKRFYLDRRGNVVDGCDPSKTPVYWRDELGFSVSHMRIIADLLNEHPDPDRHTWDQIDTEFERRVNALLT